MKTIEQLEQEAISNAIMQLSYAAKEMTLQMQNLSRNLIEASDQMRQLQDVSICISSNEVSVDGSGESLPEVSQEERDSDGWIDWGGGDCPVNQYDLVDYKLRDGTVYYNSRALVLEWRRDIVERSWDIVAYKVEK